MSARSFEILAVLLLCAALPAQTRGERPDPLESAIARAHEALRQIDVREEHSTWDDPWRARTEHYEVRTTMSYGIALQAAEALEAMLPHYAPLGLEPPAGERLPVLLHADASSYNAFGEEHGAEHSSFYASFHAAGHPERPVVALWDENPVMLRIVLTHAAVHQLVARSYPSTNLVPWLDEALAASFSFYWAPDWAVQELQRLDDGDDPVPLRAVLQSTIASWNDRTHARMVKAGLLFDYLMRVREDTAGGVFRDWVLAHLEGRRPASSRIQDLLARPAALEQELRAALLE